jgi:dTDP-4-amino-4,6-dideoxygalactose transaminase
MAKNPIINVTKTFVPPLEEYNSYLRRAWEQSWLTNYGPLSLELEEVLKERLDVAHLFLMNNGTTALQIAIKALELRGEVITTPFSYVASTSSICWENCTPVFVDIDPVTYCIDPTKIEAVITENTCAILPVHVYGIPCEVDAINAIAKKHKLPVIYDAAHSFDVETPIGASVLQYGDISTLSFHATKLFHMGEGGAIVTDNDILAHKISYLRNFGHNGQEAFFGLGINGKNSELHSAVGLSVLPYVTKITERRREITELYDRLLNIDSNRMFSTDVRQVKRNYAYYPFLFETEDKLLAAIEDLNAQNIFPRRYFYPALSTLPYVAPSNVPIAEDISRRMLCLPLFYELEDRAVQRICEIVNVHRGRWSDRLEAV